MCRYKITTPVTKNEISHSIPSKQMTSFKQNAKYDQGFCLNLSILGRIQFKSTADR